jgi:hypothetical protein
MQRFLVFAALLLPCVFAQAQSSTTIKITKQDSTTCTYPTGQVSSNSTPGQLQATAIGAATGAGCGSSVSPVSFGPASPLAPNAVIVASSPSGETTSLSFQPVNATTCTGTVTAPGIFTGGTSSTTFCNGNCAQQAAALSFPENTSTTTDSTYTVTASCTGAGSITPVSTTATVTVQKKGSAPPPGACTRTIATSAGGTFSALGGNVNMTYSGHNPATVDITSFDSIFQGAWPGSGSTVGSSTLIALFSMVKTSYVSAKFTTPANYFTAPNVPSGLYGNYSINQTLYTAPISMTISTQCGDFSPPTSAGSSVVAGCYLDAGVGGAAVTWSKAGACQLVGGQTYFLNIINANVANVTATGGTATTTCTSSTCTNPISNGPGSFTGYVPAN